MKVREIMTPNPACCTPDDTAERAARLMKNLDVGAIPIIDNEQARRPIGIVTDRDLCCGVIASGADPKSARVGDYMSKDDVASCGPEDDVRQVSDMMQARQIRRVLVVDERGACCGIVAMADLAVKAPREGKAGEAIQEVSQPAKVA